MIWTASFRIFVRPMSPTAPPPIRSRLSQRSRKSLTVPCSWAVMRNGWFMSFATRCKFHLTRLRPRISRRLCGYWACLNCLKIPTIWGERPGHSLTMEQKRKSVDSRKDRCPLVGNGLFCNEQVYSLLLWVYNDAPVLQSVGYIPPHGSGKSAVLSAYYGKSRCCWNYGTSAPALPAGLRQL